MVWVTFIATNLKTVILHTNVWSICNTVTTFHAEHLEYLGFISDQKADNSDMTRESITPDTDLHCPGMFKEINCFHVQDGLSCLDESVEKVLEWWKVDLH